tara:strand:+ start:263 stop:538 length:276 start_codon:yes stop_codon:yes gene_type:complete
LTLERRSMIALKETVPTGEENFAIAMLSEAGQAYAGSADCQAEEVLKKLIIGPIWCHMVLGLVPEFMERVVAHLDAGKPIDWHGVRMRILN